MQELVFVCILCLSVYENKPDGIKIKAKNNCCYQGSVEMQRNALQLNKGALVGVRGIYHDGNRGCG